MRVKITGQDVSENEVERKKSAFHSTYITVTEESIILITVNPSINLKGTSVRAVA